MSDEFKTWATEKGLSKWASSAKEIKELFALADLQLRDAKACAASGEISEITYHSCAFNAALESAKAAMRAFGYTITGEKAHLLTFEALKFSIGDSYFDSLKAANQRRNRSQYDAIDGTLTRLKVDAFFKEAQEIRSKVEAWIRENYPTLLK
jgi:hypothetical protein